MNNEENKKENKKENNQEAKTNKTEQKQEKDNNVKFEFNINNSEEKVKKLEKENKKLLEQIKTLNEKVLVLEIENKKNIFEFQEKAKGFQTKAQEELNKHKEILSAKLDEEKAHNKKYGAQKMLEAIIEPLLNIELAIMHGTKQEGAVSAYVIGFKMLMEQLNNELSSLGVSQIIPRVGDEFNPELHYAISTTKDFNKNKIKEVKKLGYKLHERVIKPATVVIGE